jgi:TRAP-type mannitol/chloroaromatic compound transport system permease small subunit
MYFLIKKLEFYIHRVAISIGYLAAILLIILLFNVFYDVVMRYVFNDVSIAMQELEWHLYAAVFLLGVSYTLYSDGHVRVDVIYERLSQQQQAWVNLGGTVFFVWPFCGVVAFYGIGFAHEAFLIDEISGDPGGLSQRWLIKGIISFSFFCVLFSSLGTVLGSIQQLMHSPESKGRLL